MSMDGCGNEVMIMLLILCMCRSKETSNEKIARRKKDQIAKRMAWYKFCTVVTKIDVSM